MLFYNMHALPHLYTKKRLALISATELHMSTTGGAFFASAYPRLSVLKLPGGNNLSHSCGMASNPRTHWLYLLEKAEASPGIAEKLNS